MDPSPFYVAFDNDVYDQFPTYTSIPQARGIEIARGRTGELDKVGTGTAQVSTVDLTGALDPTNPTSPWAGKLDPVKQAQIAIVNPVRLLNEDNDSTYNLFTGYVDTWGDFEVSQDGNRIEGMVALVDVLDLFANARLMPGDGDTPPHGAESDVYFLGGPNGYSAGGFKHVDQRIVQLLDLLGFPGLTNYRDGFKRDVFSGNVTVLEQVYARADQALSILDDAADAELPFVATRFIDKDGAFKFRGRFARFFPDVAGYGINFWRLGGLPQAQADNDVAVISRLPAFRRSAQDIINAAIALPSGATIDDVPGNLVTNSTSIGKYGYRSRDTDNLLTYQGHNDDLSTTTAIQETKKFAQYRVGNYKDPKTRVGQVEMVLRDPRDPLAPAQWDFITRADLSDVVTLTTTHPGGGGFDEDFFLEGIHLSIAPAPPPKFYEITATLDLSPRSLYDYNPFGEVDTGLS